MLNQTVLKLSHLIEFYRNVIILPNNNKTIIELPSSKNSEEK